MERQIPQNAFESRDSSGAEGSSSPTENSGPIYNRRGWLTASLLGSVLAFMGSKLAYARKPSPLGEWAAPVGNWIDSDLSQKFEKLSATTPAAPVPIDSQTIAFGSQPLLSQPTDEWKATIEAFLKECGLIDPHLPNFKLTGILPSRVSSQFLPIDRALSFAPIPEDNSSFSPWQVEKLLDQSADLLDRAANTLREWNEHALKCLSLAMELAEFVRLDEIHQHEVAAGFYVKDYIQSHNEWQAEVLMSSGISQAAIILDTLLKELYTTDELVRQASYSAESNFYSGYPVFTKDLGVEMPYGGAFVASDTQKSKPERDFRDSLQSSEHSLTTDSATIRSQQIAQSTTATSASSRAAGLSAQAEYESKNVKFRRARTEVARALANLKFESAASPDGVLNYIQKMRTTNAPFYRDFQDALLRINGARGGLQKVFNRKDFPESMTAMIAHALNGTPSEQSSSYFEDCLAWTRDTISWLVSFSQKDEELIIPISVRQRLQDTVWSDGLKKGTWEVSVSPQTFSAITGSELICARLRGISAFIRSATQSPGIETDVGIWSLILSCPATGQYSHQSGQTTSMDQSHISPIFIGTVTVRESFREPEIGGKELLYNVSPFGTWKVRLGQPSLNGATLGSIADLVLHFHVNCQLSALS